MIRNDGDAIAEYIMYGTIPMWWGVGMANINRVNKRRQL
jgi:hypothetical protein